MRPFYDKSGTPFTPIEKGDRSPKYTAPCPKCGAPPGHYCNKERVGAMQNASRMQPHKERPVMITGEEAADKKTIRRVFKETLNSYDPREDTYKDLVERAMAKLAWPA